MTVEVFEHTADVGLRLMAASLAQLFAEAGRAVTSLIVENPEVIDRRQAVTIGWRPRISKDCSSTGCAS